MSPRLAAACVLVFWLALITIFAVIIVSAST